MESVALDLPSNPSVIAPGSGLARAYCDSLAGGGSHLQQRNSAGRAADIQRHLGRRRMMMATANGETTVVSQHGTPLNLLGTSTVAACAAGSLYVSMRRVDQLAVASTSAVVGVFSTLAQFHRGSAAGRGGFLMTVRFGCSTGQAATTRCFCGLSSSLITPTDVDPSTLANVLGMGWDTADSQVQFMHRTGTGTTAKENLFGLNFAVPTLDNATVFEFEMYCPPNGGTVYWRVTNMTTGTIAEGSVTTDIPANTTMLAPRLYMSVAGVNSVIGLSFMNFYAESE